MGVFPTGFSKDLAVRQTDRAQVESAAQIYIYIYSQHKHQLRKSMIYFFPSLQASLPCTGGVQRLRRSHGLLLCWLP